MTKTIPYLTSSLDNLSNLRMQAWFNANKLHAPRRNLEPDVFDDDSLTKKQLMRKAAKSLRQSKALRDAADEHRQEAIKAIRAIPGFEQAEMEKFIADIRRKGRAQVIDIEKIRARGRAKLGLAAAR